MRTSSSWSLIAPTSTGMTISALTAICHKAATAATRVRASLSFSNWLTGTLIERWRFLERGHREGQQSAAKA